MKMDKKLKIANGEVSITAYDDYTGEVIEINTPVEDLVKMLVHKEVSKRQKQIRRQINEFYEDKIMIFQKMLNKARKELNGTEIKVFLFMLSIMDFENFINIPQKEIAKEVGISERLTREAIKGLKEKGYIEVYKKGRENYYRINPEIAWKGSEKSHLKVLRSRNPLID
jgi:uncharacterized membrane protein